MDTTERLTISTAEARARASILYGVDVIGFECPITGIQVTDTVTSHPEKGLRWIRRLPTSWAWRTITVGGQLKETGYFPMTAPHPMKVSQDVARNVLELLWTLWREAQYTHCGLCNQPVDYDNRGLDGPDIFAGGAIGHSGCIADKVRDDLREAQLFDEPYPIPEQPFNPVADGWA